MGGGFIDGAVGLRLRLSYGFSSLLAVQHKLEFRTRAEGCHFEKMTRVELGGRKE